MPLIIIHITNDSDP